MITVKTFETAAPGADLDIFFKARNEPSHFSQACDVPHLLTIGSHLYSRRRPQVLQVVAFSMIVKTSQRLVVISNLFSRYQVWASFRIGAFKSLGTH